MDEDRRARFAPLPDRIGHVGGIESLILDGCRYYFGFDYRGDLVLSPLIDDPGAMAVFASEYLRQLTGRQDATYWTALVAEAAEGSALGWSDTDRDITSRDLRGVPAAGSYLHYLLGALTGWDDVDPTTAIRRLPGNWNMLFAPLAEGA